MRPTAMQQENTTENSPTSAREERAAPKWTEAGLRNWTHTGRRETYTDPTIPGLVLLMTPAGAKTFYLSYRAGGGRTGKKRMLKIGRLGLDGGLEWARGQAVIQRGKIQGGADPQGEKVKARRTKPKGTVSDLCDRFLAVYVDGGKVAVSTGKTYRQHIKKNIKPTIGHLLVTEVRAPHISDLLESLTPAMASHVRSTLNRLFTRAEMWELRVGNPVKGQDKPKVDARTGHRLTADEFRILGDALKSCPHWQLRALVPILALTGMRLGEVLGSTIGSKPQRPWSDIDLVKGKIHLPAAAHKTGRKSGARTVYLCPHVVKILKAMPKDGDLILGGWGNAHNAWQALRAEVGLDHINLHDLRHTYISTADELVTASTRAVLVGHASGSMSDHYTHKQTPELVRGAGKIGKVLAGMLGL